MDKYRVDRLPWSESPAPICETCSTPGNLVPATLEAYDDDTGYSWFCAGCIEETEKKC